MENCPICGQKMELRLSFKGIKLHRDKRSTYVCKCGYSTIKETHREKLVREGVA